MTTTGDKTIQEPKNPSKTPQKASTNMSKIASTSPTKGKKSNGKSAPASPAKPITPRLELKAQAGYDNFGRGFVEVKAERVRLQAQLLICGAAKESKDFANIEDHLKSISIEFSTCLNFQTEMAQALNISLEQVGGIVFGNKAILDFIGANYAEPNISTLIKMGVAQAPNIWGQIFEYLKANYSLEDAKQVKAPQAEIKGVKTSMATSSEVDGRYVLKSDFKALETNLDAKFKALSGQLTSQNDTMIQEMLDVIRSGTELPPAPVVQDVNELHVGSLEPVVMEIPPFLHDETTGVELSREELIKQRAAAEVQAVTTDTGTPFAANLQAPETIPEKASKLEESEVPSDQGDFGF